MSSPSRSSSSLTRIGRTIDTASAAIAVATALHSATTPMPSTCAPSWLGIVNALGIAGAAQRRVEEERQQQRAGHPADTMDREHVEAVVDLEPLLDQLDRGIADRRGDHAEQHRRAGRNEPRRRGDRRETGDGTGGEADAGGLADLPLLDRQPGQRGHACRNMRVEDRGGGIVVGG